MLACPGVGQNHRDHSLWMARIRCWRVRVFVRCLAMDFAEVTCPTCFEFFEVAVPPLEEQPAEVDYDCEVCCRPMVIVFNGEEVYAKGLGE